MLSNGKRHRFVLAQSAGYQKLNADAKGRSTAPRFASIVLAATLCRRMDIYLFNLEKRVTDPFNNVLQRFRQSVERRSRLGLPNVFQQLCYRQVCQDVLSL